MGLAEQAIEDNMDITSNEDDFAIPVILESPDGIIAELAGLSTKHKQTLVSDDNRITNSTRVAVAINERNITKANPDYPVRENGVVSLKDHFASLKFVDHELTKYIVMEVFPDEKLGLIVLLLGEYKDA
jgi:hypothetical protein